MSNFKGAASMLAALPRASELLSDKGFDADRFRPALAERASRRPYHRNPTEKYRSNMTARSIASDGVLQNRRIG
jgi:hypothetical protein